VYLKRKLIGAGRSMQVCLSKRQNNKMAKQLFMDKLQLAPATGSCTGGILGKLEIISLLFISP
jgi:hypothetical protein